MCWICLPSLTSRSAFAVLSKNNGKYDITWLTFREHMSWCSLHIDVFVSFLQRFLYQTAKTWRNINEWRHIQLCFGLYWTQWDKISHCNMCIWTWQNCKIMLLREVFSAKLSPQCYCFIYRKRRIISHQVWPKCVTRTSCFRILIIKIVILSIEELSYSEIVPKIVTLELTNLRRSHNGCEIHYHRCWMKQEHWGDCWSLKCINSLKCIKLPSNV